MLTLTALLIAAMPIASAASYDPELTWRVITTEHFDIHFHQGEEQLADEFSTTVEAVWAEMTPTMKWKPKRRTQLVLVDRTDSANGYAQTAPYNTIVIYVTAPQEDSPLAYYDDWSDAITTHEFTHILHLDTHHGIVTLARAIVGKVASTNQLSPAWMVEGLATYEETEHTPGGRGRSPYVDMLKRTAALTDTWPPLGNLDGNQAAVPSGNLRYLWGEDFIRYIAEKKGSDVWTKWTHRYGSSIPFLLPTKSVFGESLQRLYGEWKEQAVRQYLAQEQAISAEGIREGRLASNPDASCISPSFSPDGQKLVWSCADLKEGSQIWLADGDGYDPDILLHDLGAKNFAWRKDSNAFVYAANHVVNRFNTWSDIYMYTLDGNHPTALTRGNRARDPEFSPDGSKLLVVTNHVQNNDLASLTIDQTLTSLTETLDHTQFSTPRYSPDGKVIALSVWADGTRDLWLYTAEGKSLRRLTADAATDRDPEWSADGKWLYFASDRTGVPNLYAIEIATERLVQWTNVTTGAVNPSASPNGKWLAYQQYSPDGWEIRLLDLQATVPLERGLLPNPVDAPFLADATGGTPVATSEVASAWEGTPVKWHSGGTSGDPELAQSSEGLDTFEQSDLGDVFGEEKDYPFKITPHRYTPWKTIRPTFWLPAVSLTPYEARQLKVWPKGLDETGAREYQSVVLGAITGNTDTLRYLAWSADASYRTDAAFLGAGGTITINRFLPVYQLGFRRSAVPFGIIPVDSGTLDENGDPLLISSGQRYWERRNTAYASVTYPYTWRSSIFARYSFTERTNRDDLPEAASLAAIPVRGTIGQVSGGWRYAWGKASSLQISPEDTRIVSVIGGVMAPFLGTQILDDNGERHPFTQFQLTGELREYVVNPWIPNHVLAGRLGLGATFGATDFFGSYLLGGSTGDAAYNTTPDEFRMVRGYSPGTDIGDMYWLTGLEYRFPIWRIDRGFGTVPIFFRYLAGAVFVDAGNAFNEITAPGDIFAGSLVGVGGELRFAGIAGWGTGVQLRLGYAAGLTEGGFSPDQLSTVYLAGGSSF